MSTPSPVAGADLVAGEWLPIPGAAITSRNPADPGQVVWSGSPDAGHVGAAVAAARAAFPSWSAWPRDRRFEALRRCRERFAREAPAIADLIARETGKPLWDSRAEADLLAAKVDITLQHEPGVNWGLARVEPFETALGATRRARAFFRPHGVMAVVGPFNFPAHLPNGHIIPALAMGNTVVLKPSDKAPAVGQKLGAILDESLQEAGAPAGVVNVVQGGAAIAAGLVSHAGIDGILFTGSFAVGRRILEGNLDRPGRVVALEMGGNNAAIVMADADLRQAVIECARSAFISTGQRCTCTRRILVERAIADRFISAMSRTAGAMTVGEAHSTPPPFLGPLISREARDGVEAFQRRLGEAGARIVLEAGAPGRKGWFITPGIAVVDRFSADGGSGFDPGCDEEVFGPLVRISIVDGIEGAIEQANATRFGLAASIFTRRPESIDAFLSRVNAGCLNVNTGTAGASSKLPFGGLGLSGNHRPAGSYSLDYCAYPVASMVESGGAATIPAGMGFDDSWLG